MKYNIHELTLKLNKVNTELKNIDLQPETYIDEMIDETIETKIKKYGTYLDSKKEMAQLYILFIFFGLHGDIISQMPASRSMPEYGPD
jgi:hypothetical protein